MFQALGFKILFVKGFGGATELYWLSDRWRLLEFSPDNRGNLVLILKSER